MTKVETEDKSQNVGLTTDLSSSISLSQIYPEEALKRVESLNAKGTFQLQFQIIFSFIYFSTFRCIFPFFLI